jgi:hypothetical protein
VNLFGGQVTAQPRGDKKSEAAKIGFMKNEKGDQARQNPSRRRFHEHQKPKSAPKSQPNTEANADYLQEVRERINALTVALADTGRMSHAKRARLENQLKQAVMNLDGRK